MSHTSGNILLHLIFSTHQRRPLIKPEFQSELFAYLGGIIREMHGAALIINGTASCRGRNRSRGQDEFLPLDSRKMERRFCLANGLWRFQRKRIQRCGRDSIHCAAGRAPQEAFVSRRVPGLPQKKMALRTTRNIFGINFLSPPPGPAAGFVRSPTACAVGCSISPLRG